MHNNKMFFSIITISILLMPIFSSANPTSTSKDQNISQDMNTAHDNAVGKKAIEDWPKKPESVNTPPPTEIETLIISKTCPILKVKEYECNDVECCKEKYKNNKDYKTCCINRVKKEQPKVNKKLVKNVDINSKNIAKLSSKVKEMKVLCISIEKELQKLEKKPKSKK